MRTFIGVTDSSWFEFLSQRPDIDEVNFWQPGGRVRFGALEPGGLFLFKLKHPYNVIAGGGYFAHFSLLPLSLAWDAFGPKNGVVSHAEFHDLIAGYKHVSRESTEDFTIGCIILQQPFFLPRHRWIPVPPDWANSIVVGKGYDLTSGYGLDLWERLRDALAVHRAEAVSEPLLPPAPDADMYGSPTLTRRRLGQGTFRVLVTDRYERRCAVSRERTLPVLQAAHIRPVANGGVHRVDNGLLLRSDIHTLFDRGYVTVTPDMVFRVSPRLRKDFDNGRIYYQHDESPLLLPRYEADRPDPEALEWHAKHVFLG